MFFLRIDFTRTIFRLGVWLGRHIFETIAKVTKEQLIFDRNE